MAGKPLEKDGTSWEAPNETGISRYEGFLHCVRKRPHSGEGGGQGGGFKRNEKVRGMRRYVRGDIGETLD